MTPSLSVSTGSSVERELAIAGAMQSTTENATTKSTSRERARTRTTLVT
jgi:hypothetical protein